MQPMQPMQPQAYAPAQAAPTGQFGPLIAEFKGATLSNTIYGVILLLLGGASLAGFVTDTQNNLPLAFIGLIFLIGAAILLVVSALNSRNTVQAYRDGLVFWHGSQSDAIPWNAVTSFYQRIIQTRYYGIPVARSYRYTLLRADGKRFVFRQYKNARQLGDIIRQETTARQLPQAQAAFQAGQTLTFGKLSLSQAGLSNGRETLPWSAVSGVRVVNGAILINRQGKGLAWARQPVSITPNFLVFLTLVQNLAGRR